MYIKDGSIVLWARVGGWVDELKEVGAWVGGRAKGVGEWIGVRLEGGIGGRSRGGKWIGGRDTNGCVCGWVGQRG